MYTDYKATKMGLTHCGVSACAFQHAHGKGFYGKTWKTNKNYERIRCYKLAIFHIPHLNIHKKFISWKLIAVKRAESENKALQ